MKSTLSPVSSSSSYVALPPTFSIEGVKNEHEAKDCAIWTLYHPGVFPTRCLGSFSVRHLLSKGILYLPTYSLHPLLNSNTILQYTIFSINQLSL